MAYYATLGEQGSPNGVTSQEKLPEVRAQELDQSSHILKNRYYLDNLGDRRLADSKVYSRLIKSIGLFLEQERPDRVVTFPDSGLTGHPDHIAISQATTEVVKTYNAQNHLQPIELYYRVISRDDRGITGESIHYDDLPITHISKDFGLQRIKRRVIEAHKTQVPAMGKIYPAFGRYAKRPIYPPEYKGDTHLLWKKETFHRVKI